MLGAYVASETEEFNYAVLFTTFNCFGGCYIYLLGNRIKELREEKEKLTGLLALGSWRTWGAIDSYYGNSSGNMAIKK